MDRKPRLTLREARRLHGANGANSSGNTSASGGSNNPNARAYRIARQSGNLNLSTRNIQTFPTEVLRLYELADEDERSWECAVLQKVDLSYNEITELPAEIRELAHVSSFKIRHNQLRQLPESFWDLTKLASLDLSNNFLEGTLSESIGQLVNLKELALDGNKLVQLPESVQLLEHLEVLKIENNALRSLPARIGDLRRLHTLTAHSNQLSALPASLAQLSNLTTLDLHKNSLVTVGDALVSLSALRFLDLHQNKISVFPELPHASALDQLLLGFNALHTLSESSLLRVKDSLSVLDVRDNRLARLPDAIAQLYRVKTLDLTNNDLHELPPGLGYLKDLHHLMVEGNPLRTIRRAVISGGSEVLKKYLRTRGAPPPGVEALEEEFDEFALRDKQQQSERLPGGAASFTESIASQHEYLFRDAAASGTLQLVGMGLLALPPPIEGLGKFNFAATLVQLNVSKNRLGRLPHAIGELAALTSLVAEECALTELHPSISGLAQLQHLRLRKNLLQAEAVDAMLAVTSAAGICGSLKELDLSNNVLTTVPQRVTLLKALDTLQLSFNRIVSLEGVAWVAMPRLSILGLADNQLESLGTVYEAQMLTSLSVENNNLRQIPLELGRCEHLRALLVAGNPQRSIRVNTIQEGTEAVLKYLRNRLPPELQSAPRASPSHVDDSENMPPANRSGGVFGRPREAASPMEKKRVRMSTAPTSSAAPPAPTQTQQQPQRLAQAASGSESSSEALDDLNKKIVALESSLEDFALTAAKRFALKKELAMVRSQKIRLLRTLQQP